MSDDAYGYGEILANAEANRVADQVHEEWPFIPAEAARKFYRSLGFIQAGEGSVRMSLWVLARVLEHRGTR